MISFLFRESRFVAQTALSLVTLLLLLPSAKITGVCHHTHLESRIAIQLL